MQLATTMFLSAAFASSLFAQSGAALGIQPGDYAVDFTVKSEEKSFLGAVMLSLSDDVIHVKGLPPLLGDSALVGIGFAEDGRFTLAVPNAAFPLYTAIYAQGAAIGRTQLVVTPIAAFALGRQEHLPKLALRATGEIPAVPQNPDAAFGGGLQIPDGKRDQGPSGRRSTQASGADLNADAGYVPHKRKSDGFWVGEDQIPVADQNADAGYVPHKQRTDAMAASDQRAGTPVLQPASPKRLPDSQR